MRLSGPTIESTVWDAINSFLRDPRTFMAEIERQRGTNQGGEADILDHIATLERKTSKVDSMETELVGLKLRELVSDEAYERQSALLRAERVHYKDEMERQKQALEAFNHKSEALDMLESMRERLLDKLDSATPENKRFVLECLDTRIDVHDDEKVEISIGVPPIVLGGTGAPSVHHSHM